MTTEVVDILTAEQGARLSRIIEAVEHHEPKLLEPMAGERVPILYANLVMLFATLPSPIGLFDAWERMREQPKYRDLVLTGENE